MVTPIRPKRVVFIDTGAFSRGDGPNVSFSSIPARFFGIKTPKTVVSPPLSAPARVVNRAGTVGVVRVLRAVRVAAMYSFEKVIETFF